MKAPDFLEPFCIHVIHDPSLLGAEAWVDFISSTFGALGMEWNGSRVGVPVHVRSQEWGLPQRNLADARFPREIALSGARRNCILLLACSAMRGPRLTHWRGYLSHLTAQMSRRRGADLLIEVQLTTAGQNVVPGRQALRNVDADTPGSPALRTGFLIRLLNSILVHRAPRRFRSAYHGGHPIFVSHAKHDGDDIARRVVQATGDPAEPGRQTFFYDGGNLQAGDDYGRRFEEAIATGSLLALVTSVYHSRGWCRWEAITAKRLQRPMVVAELTGEPVVRTLPYLGNVPTYRISENSTGPTGITDAEIRELTLLLLREALRFELWHERSGARLGSYECTQLARPPELADIAFLRGEKKTTRRTRVVYPDPPLGREEMDLLRQAFPDVSVLSLSQALAGT